MEKIKTKRILSKYTKHTTGGYRCVHVWRIPLCLLKKTDNKTIAKKNEDTGNISPHKWWFILFFCCLSSVNGNNSNKENSLTGGNFKVILVGSQVLKVKYNRVSQPRNNQQNKSNLRCDIFRIYMI